MIWLGAGALILVALWVVWTVRTPPPITVPSHLPGYDELHASPEWRAMKARLIRERAHGHCEHWLCRRRDDLQQHLLVYDCLYEGRWPYDSEVRELCAARHHGPADRARRRKEQTRRERRRVAHLAADLGRRHAARMG